jgi:tRNA-dihydrouridine synthase
MATKKDIFEEHLKAWLKAKGNRKRRGEITRHIVFVTKMHPGSVSRKLKRT